MENDDWMTTQEVADWLKVFIKTVQRRAFTNQMTNTQRPHQMSAPAASRAVPTPLNAAERNMKNDEPRRIPRVQRHNPYQCQTTGGHP